ncbi:hypothetical protein Bbelb_402630 [Branchiostoma belcheri]|nr:hypothetical protein Bbelb_402630 [Branchiostoma belcheri]
MFSYVDLHLENVRHLCVLDARGQQLMKLSQQKSTGLDDEVTAVERQRELMMGYLSGDTMEPQRPDLHWRLAAKRPFWAYGGVKQLIKRETYWRQSGCVPLTHRPILAPTDY